MAVLMRDPDGQTVEVDDAVLATNLWARGYAVVEEKTEDEEISATEPLHVEPATPPAGDDLVTVTDAITKAVSKN